MRRLQSGDGRAKLHSGASLATNSVGSRGDVWIVGPPEVDLSSRDLLGQSCVL